MHEFETRLLALAGDVLIALGRGELQPESPVVRAAAAALAELRVTPPAMVTAAGAEQGRFAAGASGQGGARAPRVAPPIEQVLAVARRMREGRVSFATACAAVAEELGTSAQAVRNACTRWLGAAAADWQPLVVGGAAAGVVVLADRVARRCPWLVDRIAEEFGVERDALLDAKAAASGTSR